MGTTRQKGSPFLSCATRPSDGSRERDTFTVSRHCDSGFICYSSWCCVITWRVLEKQEVDGEAEEQKHVLVPRPGLVCPSHTPGLWSGSKFSHVSFPSPSPWVRFFWKSCPARWPSPALELHLQKGSGFTVLRPLTLTARQSSGHPPVADARAGAPQPRTQKQQEETDDRTLGRTEAG